MFQQLTIALLATSVAVGFQSRPSPSSQPRATTTSLQATEPEGIHRRAFLLTTPLPLLLLPSTATAVVAPKSNKRCTDIETCREIGEQKDAVDLQNNPVTSFPDGVRYKVLQAGVGGETVTDNSSIDLIYTLSRAGGRYMYSQGFGYEELDLGNGQLVKDIGGLDSLRVTMGKKQVPVGIEEALRGMKRGERRRVELPPAVGLATSNWEPAPKTVSGKQAVQAYRQVLDGFGSQPAFAAPTIWDIEVLKIRD